MILKITGFLDKMIDNSLSFYILSEILLTFQNFKFIVTTFFIVRIKIIFD